VSDEIKGLRQELLIAYGMIRDLTKQVCGLNRLVLPLIRSLQPDYSRLGMSGREDIDREVQATLDRDETAALSYVEAQIARLHDVDNQQTRTAHDTQ
jgi:hypothetical protein